MAVTIKVNGVANSLVHKGSSGVSAATLPDVCKTPTPGGPVPIPYPNVSFSKNLAKGTKTVKADGGNMIAIKGSEFSTSVGDEPGTVGGVKSGTFKKESTWITYSFDVKIEGQGACRLTDKKFQNHCNTVDMGGELQLPITVVADILQQICCACNEEVQPGPYSDCKSMGKRKHACCEQKLTPVKGIGGERGYKLTSKKGKDGKLEYTLHGEHMNGQRGQMRGENYGEFCGRMRNTVFPDACALDTDGNPAKFFDFKFQCEEGMPNIMKSDGTIPKNKGGLPKLSSGTAEQKLKGKQLRKYKALSEILGIDSPDSISNTDC